MEVTIYRNPQTDQIQTECFLSRTFLTKIFPCFSGIHSFIILFHSINFLVYGFIYYMPPWNSKIFAAVSAGTSSCRHEKRHTSKDLRRQMAEDGGGWQGGWHQVAGKSKGSKPNQGRTGHDSVCHDYQLMYQLIETTINIVNKY